MVSDQRKYRKIRARATTERARYIDVGPGWSQVINDLDTELAKIDSDYEVYQVKERFGKLRFFCSLDRDPRAADLIARAQEVALVTCRVCGVRGSIDEEGWPAVLCLTHSEERT